MSSVRYVHGHTPAVSSESIAVMLGMADDDVRVDRILELAEAAASADDVLDLLIAGGVRALPDFALCERLESGSRVILRGAFEAIVDAGEPLVASGGPWLEVVIEARSVTLRRSDASERGRLMPIRGGVVLASALVITDGEQPPPLPTGRRPGGATRAKVAEPPSNEATAEPDAPADVSEAAPVSEPVAEPEPAAALEAEVPGLAEPSAHTAGVAGTGEFDFLFGATTSRPPDPAKPMMLNKAALDKAAPPPEEAAPSSAADVTSDAFWTRPSPLTIDRDLLAGEVPAPAPPAGGLLITSFPWAPESGGVPAVPAAPMPTSAAATPGDAPGESSPHVDVWAPTVSPDAGALEESAADRTINRAHLLGQGPVVPNVLAARCPVGHLSPGFAAECRVCREPIPAQTPFETPRPRLGLLRLSTGAVVALDRGAVLGRNPRVPSDYSGEQPNLVRVVDPEKGMSSQHLEVSLDYWNVNVRDLGSTNGTEVVLPGAMPQTLRAGFPIILEPGSRVIMGGTVSFVFEVTE